MKKKYISLLILVMTVFSILPAKAEETAAETVRYYVDSINGTNTGKGTIDDPFKDLAQAQRAIKNYKNDKDIPVNIEVIFREGEYYVSERTTINAELSGYEGYTLAYKGYENEKAVFKGSQDIDISKMRKVTDNSILTRLPEESRDKVGYIDLKEQGITDLPPIIPNVASDSLSNTSETIQFFYDGEEQPIAQWPNGTFEYSIFTSVTSGGIGLSGKGGTFQYKEDNPSTWKEPQKAYVIGFFGYDYRSDRVMIQEIDTDNKYITLKSGTAFGIKSSQSRRWKAYNILEELDSPGEWYIDYDNMYFYYYPPYTLANSRLEMSILDDYMFYLDGASNIRFENLTFTQSRASIFYMQQSENITIDNCVFRDLSSGVIRTQRLIGGIDEKTGGAAPSYGKVLNLVIENSIFYNIDAAPFNLYTSKMYELEPSGLIIRNNYFNQNGEKRASGVGTIGGVESKFVNNLAHNFMWEVGTTTGWDCLYQYNELGNALGETADCGALYTGRSYLYRGCDISYNYIHDCNPRQDVLKPFTHNRAIYYDDAKAGEINHHNILVNVDKAVSASGSSTQSYSNTVVNSTSGILMLMYTDGRSALADRYKNIMNTEYKDSLKLILERYPDITREMNNEDLTRTRYMKIYDNVLFDSGVGTNPGAEKLANQDRVENNNNFTGTSEFVDVENQDYRIKKDSYVLQTNPDVLNEENFDIEKIGIQFNDKITKEELQNTPFRKISPVNGARNVVTKDAEFSWNKVMGADEYRFVLATDPEMKNIVEDKIVPYNYCTVDSLNSGNNVYYWTVYARNTTRQLSNEWEANGIPYVFTTSKFDFLDTDILLTPIEELETILTLTEEGTQAGQLKIGSTEKINMLLKKAYEAMTWKKGSKSQADIEAVRTEIENFLSGDYLNRGFYDLGKTIDKENTHWNFTSMGTPDRVEFSDGELVISTTDKDGSYQSVQIENMDVAYSSMDVIYSFALNMTFDESWFGFGIRSNQDNVVIYGGENYYFVVKEDIIELQIQSPSMSGIILTIPNEYIKNGEWCDVSFGVIDCVFGQLMCMYVDGKTVFEYMDTTVGQIKKQGGFKFYVVGTKNGQILKIKSPEQMPELDINEIIRRNMFSAAVDTCKAIEETTGPAYIASAKSDKYYLNGEMHQLSDNAFIERNEKIYGKISELEIYLDKDLSGETVDYSDENGEYVNLNNFAMKHDITYNRNLELFVLSKGNGIEPANLPDLFTTVRGAFQALDKEVI